MAHIKREEKITRKNAFYVLCHYVIYYKKKNKNKNQDCIINEAQKMEAIKNELGYANRVNFNFCNYDL